MKKIGFLLVLAFFLLAFPGLSRAESSGAHIYLDGVELEQPAQAKAGNINGSVMVPLRVIVESLGYDVNWEKETGVVTITQGETDLRLTVGSGEATVDGKSVSLSAPPVLQSNSTMVPLRFVGEQTGLKVSWDNDSKSAYLYSPNGGAGSSARPGMGSASPGAETDEVLPPDDSDVEDAYIPETPVEDESDGAGEIGYIKGISFSENRLMIAGPSDIEPNVFTMNGPDRLVVDIPDVAFDESFGDMLPLDETKRGQFAVSDYPDVTQVRYSLFSSEPSTVRVVVDLTHSVQYQVTNDGNGLLIIDLTASSANSGLKPGAGGKPLVVIDAGHGGSAPGATSINNKLEKEFTLAVVLKVEQLLRQESGLDYVLTRSADDTLSLEDRAKLANDLNATIFVSVHGNSFDGASNPTGLETYYTRDDSISLANVMHNHMVAATGLTDRGVRQKSLHVTRETKMPAVLLEAGYLSNVNDEALMYSEDFQQRLAEAIVAGIKEYLGL
ncbi:N-acetylmuramoyl-L-alanine amidase family protein [Paenibacillus sp. M1]|uniref:N-acetylmuramoyl-L-alanine amidase family protein n=1 Tax=Paenibacillus haidiansis TaxID=1574488 RepID=A0ABU7VN28_9BACL